MAGAAARPASRVAAAAAAEQRARSVLRVMTASLGKFLNLRSRAGLALHTSRGLDPFPDTRLTGRVCRALADVRCAMVQPRQQSPVEKGSAVAEISARSPEGYGHGESTRFLVVLTPSRWVLVTGPVRV
jgi:hypothetical protein